MQKQNKKRTHKQRDDHQEEKQRAKRQKKDSESESSSEEEVQSENEKPAQPVLPKTAEEKELKPRLFVILEQANLETVLGKTGSIEIINSD